MTSERPISNVEIPRALWLASSDYNTTQQAETLKEKIEDIFGYIYTEETVDNCEKFIRDKYGPQQYEQIFFIVHIDFIEDILNRDIHDLRVIESIFIFNLNKSHKYISLEKFSKVHRTIFTDSKDLLTELSTSVDIFCHKLHTKPSTLKEYTTERTTNVVNNIADFSELWYPLFIDLLLNLPLSTDFTYQEHINKFADQCRLFYAHSSCHLAEINQFISSSDSNYIPKRAIEYYTRGCFLYKRVNKALRQQNIEAIFYFHFFLLDIHAQLQSAYNEFSADYEIGDIITVYRGQGLYESEMEFLREKRRDGSLVTVNSYFSTSLMRNVAFTFKKGISNSNLLPVLMEINVEFKSFDKVFRKPFAFIGHLSKFGCEEYEVLFSIGSFFRVDHIAFDDNNKIWIVKMTYIFDEDHTTVTENYTSLKTCTIEEKIIKVGTLLSHRNEYSQTNKVKIFYQHFLKQNFCPSIRAACHIGLGWLNYQQKQLDIAIQYLEQGLNLCKQLENGPTLNYLCVLSYCCIGAIYRQQKDLTKALEFYKKAYTIDKKAISIDKYAFYNSFTQVASINIALLHKLMNRIDLAWTIFKDILADETNKLDYLHSAIYVTIAEADLSDMMNCKNLAEKNKWFSNWTAFFDLGFQELSPNYRKCMISGGMSIGYTLGKHETTYGHAISCFEKVIQISQKYLKNSPDYYGVVLQCHKELARLYRLVKKYSMAIEYASKILKLCRENDLRAIIDCYTNLVDVYEEKLQAGCSTPNPNDISLQLCDIDFLSAPFKFERDEFVFGQFKKGLNPSMIQQKKIEHRLVYCYFKLAALYYEQHNKTYADEFLHRAIELLPDDLNVQFIFQVNHKYLEKKYDKIIDLYRLDLEQRRLQNEELCIGEDAFFYIAHLFKLKNETINTYNYYIEAIGYFEKYPHVCKHTRICFLALAEHYRAIDDLASCISIYQRYVHYLLAYHENICQVHRSIVNIIESSFEYMIDDPQRIIRILKYFIQLVMKNPDDVIHIDEDFQNIMAQYRVNKKYLLIAAQIYEFYVENILENVNATSCVKAVVPIFLQAALNYQLNNDAVAAIELYQRIVGIKLKYYDNREKIIEIFKKTALESEIKNKQITMIINIYDSLCTFVYEFPAKIKFKDHDLITLIVERLRQLDNRFSESIVLIYKKIIEILNCYCEKIEPTFDKRDYLKLIKYYYKTLAIIDATSMVDYYSSLLEKYLKYDLINFENMKSEIISLLADKPLEMHLIFVSVSEDALTLDGD